MNKFFLAAISLSVVLPACQTTNTTIPSTLIKGMNLKRGEVISCGPADKQFGSTAFQISNAAVMKEFNFGVQLLHSFEYDEAEKAFAAVIDKQPDCAMAYWGVAMSNFHALWTPPTEAELVKGEKAIAIARSLESSERETAYIDAIAGFFTDWKNNDHRSRCLEFEKRMEKVYKNYPDDKEAVIFYALSLVAAADPNDKTFHKQKKAGAMLNALYPGEPDHPGIVHYLIHAYDSPELAKEGLEAARKYAAIAPSSAHALHMPSHIFTRLGLWDECIKSNIASVTSAQCYAQAAGIKGHWDEELHGLDYLVYSYLQKGESDSAKKYWDYLETIKEVSPLNFKVSYAFASIPSRYILENKMWKEAATLSAGPAGFPWQKYPWQQAIVHFTRLLGNVHTGKLALAKDELKELSRLHDTLVQQKDAYKAAQVAIQLKAGEAWIKLKEGDHGQAQTLMQTAAGMEDKTEKHPVTPGEVIPARELLADLYMELKQPAKALAEYEADLQKRPNRFNALYGAAVAAERSGNVDKAGSYYHKLLQVSGHTASKRSELTGARKFLKL